MYDEELLDRGLHPRFKGKMAEILPIKLVNASCGDEISVFLKVKDGVIVDGKWDGNGCAISLASADVFIEEIKGKTVEEAKELSDDFSKMILGEESGGKRLTSAKCLKCVSRMPARANCAKLAWKSLEKIT